MNVHDSGGLGVHGSIQAGDMEQQASGSPASSDQRERLLGNAAARHSSGGAVVRDVRGNIVA